jgi:hypothetical protein
VVAAADRHLRQLLQLRQQPGGPAGERRCRTAWRCCCCCCCCCWHGTRAQAGQLRAAAESCSVLLCRVCLLGCVAPATAMGMGIAAMWHAACQLCTCAAVRWLCTRRRAAACGVVCPSPINCDRLACVWASVVCVGSSSSLQVAACRGAITTPHSHTRTAGNGSVVGQGGRARQRAAGAWCDSVLGSLCKAWGCACGMGWAGVACVRRVPGYLGHLRLAAWLGRVRRRHRAFAQLCCCGRSGFVSAVGAW